MCATHTTPSPLGCMGANGVARPDGSLAPAAAHFGPGLFFLESTFIRPGLVRCATGCLSQGVMAERELLMSPVSVVNLTNESKRTGAGGRPPGRKTWLLATCYSGCVARMSPGRNVRAN